jgi:hypothetical protein
MVWVICASSVPHYLKNWTLCNFIIDKQRLRYRFEGTLCQLRKTTVEPLLTDTSLKRTPFSLADTNTYDPNDFFTKTFTMSRITPRNNMLK